jgi:nucleoside-diphosphate kinase
MIGYSGDILEDLKQMSYLLRALGHERFSDAANHALQILDKNRDVISDYESTHGGGLHEFNALGASEPQRTFVMLKPDAFERGLVDPILDRIRRAGYTIFEPRAEHLSPETVDAHYREHIGKPFYPALRAFTVSGPVLLAIVVGYNVVAGLRELIGPTNPNEAPIGTIRGDFNEGSGIVRRNLIHASDSPASATRELALHFPPAAQPPTPGEPL